MRKFNAVLTAVIMVLFLLHAILGGFQLIGVGATALKTIAWISVGLIAIHVILGTKMTIDSLRVWKKTGVGYFKENKIFWARRISGFAVMILLVFHLTAFSSGGAIYRLQWFTTFRLVTQLLLVVSIAVHVITNVRPMLISFGVKSLRPYVGDILVVLTVLLLFMAAAFVIYYLRWNVVGL